MRPRPSLLAVLAAVPLALTACGSSESAAGGADPAAAVPGSAPIYIELVPRPEGDVRDDAEEALGKILRTDDPGGQVAALFDRATEGELTWEQAREWMGSRVGVFFTDFREGAPVGALVADTTDPEKAEQALRDIVGDEEDVATAVVEDYAILGTTDGVEAVRRTLDGGDALSDSPDYSAARDAVGADEALALVYVEPQSILDAIGGALQDAPGSPFSDPQSLGFLRDALAKAGRAVALAVSLQGDAVRMEGAAIGAPAGTFSTAAADGLAALPADAWLAIGFGDLGTTLTRAVGQIQQLSALTGQTGGPDFEKLLEAFRRKTGTDIRQDFLSWMGDGAIYARGTSASDVGGAITVRTKDPERSRRAVGIIAQGLQGAGAQVRDAKVEGYDVAVELRNPSSPVSLFIAANDERFSIGVNPQALTALLDPQRPLSDSDVYEQAEAALGEGIRPMLIVDAPPIIGLLESFGITQAEGYAQAKPYLDALGTISAGTAHDGDVQRFALAVGLR